jgi:hypothetical protein
MMAVPAARVPAEDWYVPLPSTTEPVGGVPLPVTFTVTLSDCDVERLCDAGVTVTVGVNWLVTVTVAEPDALA